MSVPVTVQAPLAKVYFRATPVNSPPLLPVASSTSTRLMGWPKSTSRPLLPMFQRSPVPAPRSMLRLPLAELVTWSLKALPMTLSSSHTPWMCATGTPLFARAF